MKSLGDKIKDLRTERDLTMDMLVADMKARFEGIKMDKSMLSRWERGENDPSLENAKYLSIYFNVSLDYLIGLTDIRTPSRLLAYAKRIQDARAEKPLSIAYGEDLIEEMKS